MGQIVWVTLLRYPPHEVLARYPFALTRAEEVNHGLSTALPGEENTAMGASPRKEHGSEQHGRRRGDELADGFVIYTDSETWHGKAHPFKRCRATVGGSFRTLSLSW